MPAYVPPHIRARAGGQPLPSAEAAEVNACSQHVQPPPSATAVASGDATAEPVGACSPHGQPVAAGMAGARCQQRAAGGGGRWAAADRALLSSDGRIESTTCANRGGRGRATWTARRGRGSVALTAQAGLGLPENSAACSVRYLYAAGVQLHEGEYPKLFPDIELKQLPEYQSTEKERKVHTVKEDVVWPGPHVPHVLFVRDRQERACIKAIFQAPSMVDVPVDVMGPGLDGLACRMEAATVRWQQEQQQQRELPRQQQQDQALLPPPQGELPEQQQQQEQQSELPAYGQGYVPGIIRVAHGLWKRSKARVQAKGYIPVQAYLHALESAPPAARSVAPRHEFYERTIKDLSFHLLPSVLPFHTNRTLLELPSPGIEGGVGVAAHFYEHFFQLP